MDCEGTPIVIDNGSYQCKIGFAGQEIPRAQVRTIVGRQKQHMFSSYSIESSNCYIGEETEERKSVLQLIEPFNHGIVIKWDDMIEVWRYCIQRNLHVNGDEHPFLMTETPGNPNFNREKTLEVMFETFNVPAFYLAVEEALSLRASGKTTGLILNVGHSVSKAVPIYEGKILDHAVQKHTYGGRDLTFQMRKFMTDKPFHFSPREDDKVMTSMKQNTCYISLDYEQQLKNNQQGTFYELPDGQVIPLGVQRFKYPEIFFKPQLTNLENPGLAEMVHRSIQKCDENHRKDLYQNIILSGGSTMLPNLSQRLLKDVTALAPQGTKVNVIAPENRKYSAWIGGSTLSLQPAFKQKWITREDYLQNGSFIVQKKCKS